MNINLTLLLQVIHFFIAYIIITKLLLKPALASIRSGEQLFKELNALVLTEKNNLQEKQLYKQKIWQSYQNSFRQNSPKVFEEEQLIEPGKIKINKIENLSDDKLQKLSQEITNALKQKVING